MSSAYHKAWQVTSIQWLFINKVYLILITFLLLNSLLLQWLISNNLFCRILLSSTIKPESSCALQIAHWGIHTYPPVFMSSVNVVSVCASLTEASIWALWTKDATSSFGFPFADQLPMYHPGFSWSRLQNTTVMPSLGAECLRTDHCSAVC